MLALISISTVRNGHRMKPSVLRLGAAILCWCGLADKAENLG